MKINNLAQFEAQITQKLLPCYIISGDELLLKQQAMTALRRIAKKAGFVEYIRYTMEPQANADELYLALNSLSLLHQKKILSLDCTHYLPNKDLQSILKAYLQNPSPDILVIVDMMKIDNKTAKLAWVVQMENSGILMSVWPLAQTELIPWIKQNALKKNVQLTTEMASLIAEYVEGNLLAAHQTIEKLALLNPKVIDKTIITAMMIDESHYSIYDFIDHVIAGRASEAMHSLHRLETEGIEPVLILWGITRELRLLTEFAELIEKGEKLDFLFNKYRIFYKRQSTMRQFLRRFSMQDCWKHLSHAQHVDKIIKGALPGNGWDELHLLCLRLI